MFFGHKNITNSVPRRMALCFNRTPVSIYSLLPASNARSKGIHKKSTAETNVNSCVCVCARACV